MSSYSTKTLLGVKKLQKQHVSFFRTMFFKREAFSDSLEIAIDKVVPNLRLAPFVSPMVAGKARKQNGFSTTSYAPPYLKPMDVVVPKNMQYRMAGEALNGEFDMAARRRATIAFLLEDQDLSCERSEEKMCVDGVLTGKFVVEDSEEHEAMEIDYGRSAENTVVLVGAARWSQRNKDTTDMEEIISNYADLSTGLPSVLIFDKKGFSLFKKFSGVKEALNSTLKNGNSYLEMAPQLKDVVQFKGEYGDYQVYVYNGYYEDDDKTKHHYLPENTMIIAPGNYDGVMGYGAIQDADANAEGIVSVKRYPSNWRTKNPSVENLMTQSAPMPIMPDADEFVVVTVDGPA